MVGYSSNVAYWWKVKTRHNTHTHTHLILTSTSAAQLMESERQDTQDKKQQERATHTTHLFNATIAEDDFFLDDKPAEEPDAAEDPGGEPPPVLRLPPRCGFMSKTHSFCFDLQRLVVVVIVFSAAERRAWGGAGLGG